MKRIALLLLLTGCGISAPETPNQQHAVQVLSVSCSMVVDRPRADVSVRNIGATTIDWAKGLVSFGGAMQDNYFDPRPLRPGGTASLTVFGNRGDSSACSLESVRDGDGFAAPLRR